MEKVSLRVLSFLGVVVFLPLFLLTFVDTQLIETSGESFIEWKLQSETNKKIDSLSLPEPTRLEIMLGVQAREMRAQTELKLEEVKRQLRSDAPAILSAQIAKLQNLDCECRKKWETSLRQSMQTKLVSLERAKAKLMGFSHAKYMQIVEELTLDVRIFLGVNSLVFLFLLFASFMRPMAIKHLFLPSGLMMVSAAICSYFYIFEQNWFYTIIYNDYLGFGYVAYLILVFVILSDIVFNKARVTTEVINACLKSVGHAGSLVSC